MKQLTKQILPFLLLLLFCSGTYSQNAKVRDSLFYVLRTGKADTAYIYNEITRYYYYSTSYDSCVFFNNLAEEKATENKDTLNLCRAYNWKANINYDYGFYDEALKNLLKSLSLAKSLKDTQIISYLYNNLGKTYQSKGDYEASNRYFHLALKYNISGNNFPIYNNIGIGFLNKHQYDSALTYFQLALKNIKNGKDSFSLGTVYGNLGVLYRRLKQYNKSLDYLTLSYQIIQKERDSYKKNVILLNKGKTYVQINDYDNAEKCYNEVIENAKKNNFNKLLLNAYRNLYELLQEKGDYKNALDYYEKYHNLNDSITDAEIRKQVSRLRKDYKIAQKIRVVRTLEQQKRFQEKKVKLQRIIIWGLVILLGLILILLFIIFRLKQKQLAVCKNIVEKNIEILEKEEQVKKSKIKTNGEVNGIKKEIPDETLKYSYSNLTPLQKQQIVNLLEEVMEEEKMFLDKDLTLTKLADKIGVSRTYVSQVINETFKKNFNAWVNEYRIKEAQRLLISKPNYSIEGVAHEVGFKSKPSFNAAFKQYVGVTPSFFLRNYKRN